MKDVRRTQRRAVRWLVASCLVASGCGSGEPPRGAVQGTVSYQGKPLSEGSIVFFPTGALKGQPTGGEIRDGKYTISLENGPLVGVHRVEIQGLKKTGRKVPDLLGDVSQPNRPLIEEKVNFLPPQFNTESRLTGEIREGENVLDFAL